MAERPTPPCAVYVDMGTTNTRVWLVAGEEVVARADDAVGVRDTARDGSHARVHDALRRLVSEVRRQGAEAGAPPPEHVAAAGMITSPLGLAEVPHVPAPAGVAALAAGVQRHRFPEITDLDVLLVPGVRTGPEHATRETVGDTDVMRGEETLCVGLLERGWLRPGGVLLNLGSHWKAVRIDAAGRVAASVTSMSGELVHASQTQTILAGSVPAGRPSRPQWAWVEAGMAEQRRSGLARALFCVRLLEQRAECSPEQRMAFLVGAFLAADLDALWARGVLSSDTTVTISGGGALAEVVARALFERSLLVEPLPPERVEEGLLTGLRRVIGASAN